MDWTNVIARYSTHFTWQAQPLFAINDPRLMWVTVYRTNATITNKPYI